MDSKGIRSDKLDLCNKCGKMFLKIGTTNVCPRCSGQKYLPAFGENFKGPHSLEMKKSESRMEIGTKEKDKKWSRKFDCCVNCGGNDVKHVARGLCLNCYERETATRNRGKKRDGSASRKLNYEYLYEEYINKMRSLGDIAKESCCSRQYVMNLMKKYGIERRTQSKARIEAIKKGKFERFEYHEIDEKFFSKWSPEMAWVLGLLFTDGTIDDTRVAIHSVDIDLLEKIKTLLESTKPIQKRAQSYDKSKHIYEFGFYREKMRDDLYKLGLQKRKSLTMVFPDIPEEYMRHFIRGCWDGDGSIFFDRGRLVASCVTGSKQFIEKLVHELFKIGIFKNTKPYHLDYKEMGYLYVKKTYSPMTDEFWSKYPDGKFPMTIHMKNINAYYMKIQTRENIEKLFHYFYDGVDESMYLTRKHNVFLKGLNLRKKRGNRAINS